ncbi:metal ABC transporter solute-binding protein, Zn/Mn family [Persicobacter diffluens]|uniref:Manganese transporter n=1 Tax=Persicobacter diffluens TaxID=981 RepID=A0AAN4VY94_9BACT|nr:manganese transporter [Persicobacter diffluens]
MLQKTKYLLFSLYLGMLLTFSSCDRNPQMNNGKPNIVCTTGMIGDALKHLVKDSANVISLMGPGVDPHLYKATHGDIDRLARADVIFYNGLHLEGKMGEVLHKLERTRPVVAVAKSIPENALLSVEDTEVHDPHIWFDLMLWDQAVAESAIALREIYPDWTDMINANEQAYRQEIQVLHQEVKRQIATIPQKQRVMITAHDAFGYFGKAYDIEVRGLQGISTLSEFGLRGRVELVNYIIDKGIKAIFVESSVSPKAIESVVEACQQKGHDLKIGGSLYSDAMGAPGTAEGTYLGMVRANVHTIVNALK